MFDIVTIGTITRDVFIQSPLFKVTKEDEAKTIGEGAEAQCFALGSKISVGRPIFAGGGGAYNAAVTFARQGFRVGIVGSIGDDLAGQEIRRLLKSEGVKHFLRIDKKEGTGYSVVLMAPGGERTILTYRGATDTISEKEISYRTLRAAWTYVVPGAIPFSVISSLVSKTKKQGGKIAMNPSKHYLTKIRKQDRDTLFSLLDVIIMNREEASLVTDIARDNEREIFQAFDRIIPGIVVVTDGPRGASVFDGEYFYHSKTFPEKRVVDRTGAGDAFGAGFVAGLIQKGDIGYALRLASANATSVVESVGATTGVLTKKHFSHPRWKNVNLDIERL